MTFGIRCPAKINLSLSVGPLDPSGFHPISSVFQAINLCDVLTIDLDTSSTTFTSNIELPARNTVTKSLDFAQELVNLPPMRIHLEKNIPNESGLGGGSSDAAGMLKLLGKMGIEIPWDGQLAVAGAVGKDVPFFLTGGRAMVSGYGEHVTPLPDRPEQWYLVAQPRVTCSTPAMYSALDAIIRDFLPSTLWRNDFELVAPCECLDLKERLLDFGAQHALLSGSGSCVFAEFDSEKVALQVQEKISEQSWVVRSLAREEQLWTL